MLGALAVDVEQHGEASRAAATAWTSNCADQPEERPRTLEDLRRAAGALTSLICEATRGLGQVTVCAAVLPAVNLIGWPSTSITSSFRPSVHLEHAQVDLEAGRLAAGAEEGLADARGALEVGQRGAAGRLGAVGQRLVGPRRDAGVDEAREAALEEVVELAADAEHLAEVVGQHVGAAAQGERDSGRRSCARTGRRSA